MEAQKQLIIVGDGLVGEDKWSEGQEQWTVATAKTCEDVRRLVRDAREVRLAVTEGILPDGNWCDLLRLLVEMETPAKVEILGRDGRPSFCFDVDSRGARFVRTTDPSAMVTAA